MSVGSVGGLPRCGSHPPRLEPGAPHAFKPSNKAGGLATPFSKKKSGAHFTF
jgi:hypothetical protein